ncbi:hypothetical protein K458DRAFT_395825 [Lentithecium fluviatile CBS 122367]|uniref:Uncharacterized protein n=1 Tax=Lentithecium fluviatile CBS 122367 TaxID=1168545 RepID=A0A6G1IHX9_9PLEO|nr:hypothetical protein K458DRAFT_395825 [Lentithecium fluviatile CBS 122367]
MPLGTPLDWAPPGDIPLIARLDSLPSTIDAHKTDITELACVLSESMTIGVVTSPPTDTSLPLSQDPERFQHNAPTALSIRLPIAVRNTQLWLTTKFSPKEGASSAMVAAHSGAGGHVRILGFTRPKRFFRSGRHTHAFPGDAGKCLGGLRDRLGFDGYV